MRRHTILIGDDSSGDTREECYNKILAKNTFVQMPHHDNKESKTKKNSEIKLHLHTTHWWDGTPIIRKEMNDNKHKVKNLMHNNNTSKIIK